MSPKGTVSMAVGTGMKSLTGGSRSYWAYQSVVTSAVGESPSKKKSAVGECDVREAPTAT